MSAMATQHALNLKALPDTRSRDRLKVCFNRDRSERLTLETGIEFSCYDVENKTKKTNYECDLWVDAQGRKCGRCNCLARIVCKHVLRSILLHVARKRALLKVGG